MKKSIMFLSFVLAIMLCGVILTKPTYGKNVRALSEPSGHIIVVGKGEVKAEPDTVRVSFCLKCRAETLQASQTKMRESIKDITTKINAFNNNAEVYTNYSASYPVFENGLLAYEIDSCLIVKSPTVDNVNGLIDAIIEAGATSVDSVNYLLTNKDEAYISALKQAKQNAEEKASAIYENVTLIGLKEEAVYNYCEGSENEKIRISAKVTAFYKVNSNEMGTNNDGVANNETTQVSSSSLKTNNDNKILEETKKIESSETQRNFQQNKEKEDVNKLTNVSNKESKTSSNISSIKNNIETNNLKEDLKKDSTSLEDNKEKLENKEIQKQENKILEGTKEIVENKDKAEVKEQEKTNVVKENTAKTPSQTNGINKTTSKTKASQEQLSVIDANGNIVVELI